MKKVFLILAFCLIFTLSFASAEEGLVNLINDHTYVQQNNLAYFEDGVLILEDINLTGEYLINFSVPRLTNQYIWEGDITIKEIDPEKGYSGVRFCIGYDDATGNYINLILTKSMGVSANQRGTTPVDDLIPVSKETFDRDLEEGMTFHFEIIRDGAHVIMKVDGETVIDKVFDEQYNLFTEGDELNLGFVSCYCVFEVKNLAVYDENVEITPEPTPTDTPAPTEEPTDTPQQTPSATEKTDDNAENGGISPVIIIVAVIAAVAVVGTVVFLISSKNK
jgi:hypothetical protein